MSGASNSRNACLGLHVAYDQLKKEATLKFMPVATFSVVFLSFSVEEIICIRLATSVVTFETQM